MGVASNATTTAVILSESFTRLGPTPTTLSERERVRMEFYQTYDVMTGVSIRIKYLFLLGFRVFDK